MAGAVEEAIKMAAGAANWYVLSPASARSALTTSSRGPSIAPYFRHPGQAGEGDNGRQSGGLATNQAGGLASTA